VSRRDTAVVCIDLQVDFLDADRGRVAKHYDKRTLAHAHAARDNAARLLAAARRGGLTVAHSRSHRYGARIHRDLVGRGDAGYALDAAVAARPGEIVVDKWTFGAFASTDLEARLRRRGVTRILLCGVLTNVCVMATAVQACDRLFRVCLVEDATGAFDAGWHESAVGLINGPQVAAGHARAPAATGLYFGEKTTVANVEAALAGL
jgi:nicotinamidase-related amidase